MAESDEWATVETVEDDVYYESRQPSSAVPGSNINDYFNNRKITALSLFLQH